MRANIRELKDHLSAYIHDVRGGVEVVITSHGVPVAKLVPITVPEAAETLTPEQFIQELDILHRTLSRKSSIPDNTVIQMRREEEY